MLFSLGSRSKLLSIIAIFSIALIALPKRAEAIVLDDFLLESEVHLESDTGSTEARYVPKDSINSDLIFDGRSIRLHATEQGTSHLIISNAASSIDEGSNSTHPLDVNGDGVISPIDALIVKNHLNSNATYKEALDTNKDGAISAIDMLLIINYLNSGGDGSTSIVQLESTSTPSLRLINDATAAGIGVLELDGDSDPFTLKKDGLPPLNLLARDGNAFILNVQYNAPRGEEAKILVKVWTGSSKYSECDLILSENTTNLPLDSDQSLQSIAFDDCISPSSGGADFRAVTAIELTLNTTETKGAQIAIAAFGTDSIKFGNTEGGGTDDQTPPSSPFISPEESTSPRSNLSPTPSGSLPPTESPEVSESSSPSPSASTPGCISPCGCRPDGTPIEHDECGLCGGPGKDGCGFCPHDPNRVEDLGCGCGLPGRSGCDNECGSTKTTDVCGVCGGDGSSCQVKCKFYTVDIVPESWDGNPFTPFDLVSGAGQGLSCIQRLLNQYGLSDNRPITCIKLGRDRFYCPPGANNDDLLAEYLANKLSGASIFAYIGGTRQRMLLDENCNAVPSEQAKAGEICGNLQYRFFWSPISLLLDPEKELDETSKIIQFQLNPHKAPQYVTWRASAHAPLLVYDPKNTGDITSGAQLFGDWTFGGKQLASLDTANVGHSKWENGFEALASLDTNNDSVISDHELQFLSLWFDNNQDGISQKGEVIRLEKLGISELSLGAVEKYNGLGDLVINDGFTRTVDGKVYHGKMVDWFTRDYATSQEAIGYESMRAFEKEEIPTAISDTQAERTFKKIEVPQGTERNESNTSKLASENFSGIWYWKLNGDIKKGSQDLPPVGAIIIDDYGDTVKGRLLAEIPFEQIQEGKKYRNLEIAQFKGEKFIRESDGSVGLYFTIQDEGISTITRMYKVNDSLSGETENTFTPKEGLPSSVWYSWDAIRWEGGTKPEDR